LKGLQRAATRPVATSSRTQGPWNRVALGGHRPGARARRSWSTSGAARDLVRPPNGARLTLALRCVDPQDENFL